MLLTVSSTIEFSSGWTTSSSNNNAAAASSATQASTSTKTSSIRKRGRMHNGIYSIRDIHTSTHKIKSKQQSYPQKINRENDSIIGSQLPWIDYNNENENKNEKYENNVYLFHWEWQLSYFQQHLTNFRINDDTTEAQQHDKTTDYNDLMYTHTTDDNEQKDQRIYTVSYQSEEYRDIRITYMNFPGSQFFRCMCYPNSIHVPILGMAYMQFGSNGSNGNGGNGGNGSNSITKNMAFMDYQPILLPTSSSLSTSDNVNNKYKSELVRIRSEIPSMNTPISHKHFDSEEERKYFTDCPLICKWDTTNSDSNDIDSNSEFHHQELVRAQHDYIKTHIKLTKEDRMMTHKNSNNNNNTDTDTILLKLHSDFDTFVSAKEPAGKLLCHAFGTKIGNQLVHRILFPLSRNKI